jgi:hypothetical protein
MRYSFIEKFLQLLLYWNCGYSRDASTHPQAKSQVEEDFFCGKLNVRNHRMFIEQNIAFAQ